MTRKILIDGDPGIDEALAITMALFDPRLEVVAITACAGIVEADRSGQNLLSLIESLDPPKRPRLAVGSDPEGRRRGIGDRCMGKMAWEIPNCRRSDGIMQSPVRN